MVSGEKPSGPNDPGEDRPTVFARFTVAWGWSASGERSRPSLPGTTPLLGRKKFKQRACQSANSADDRWIHLGFQPQRGSGELTTRGRFPAFARIAILTGVAAGKNNSLRGHTHGDMGMLRGLLSISMLVFALGCTKSSDRVVVYSAQDEDFAAGVFRDFESQSKLKVTPKYDTEANKSVGLAAELEVEAPLPRCDVHWNNEILGTIRLARKGIYETYSSPNAKEFPAWSKATDGTWQAFAERARVLIVNTNLVPAADRPRSMFDLLDPKWKGRIAMAKPLFGTTATHAACLFEVMGAEPAKAYFRQLKGNDVQLVPGNKQVARGVAEGTFAFGFTDTDDAILEMLAGKPVAIVFPDATGHAGYNRLGTVFIPNTLAVVKGGPNPTGAKQLIDYLLASESKLARGGGYQFPVNPALTTSPHSALKSRRDLKAAEVDFDKAADLWDQSQEFLKNEFAR